MTLVRLDESSLPVLGTGPSKLLATPAATPDGGYHVIPAGVSGTVENYTLIYDLYVSSENSGTWNGLFQTDLTNQSDGDLFMRRDGADGTHFGIGISGNYPGNAAMDEWHRIAFTLETVGSTTTIRRFIDGVFVGAIEKEVTRYAFEAEEGFYIMADENNEMLPSFLSAFAFIPRALSDADIAAKGGVDGLGAASGFHEALEFDFASGDFAPSIGEGSITPRSEAEAGSFVDAGEDAPEPGKDKYVLRFDAATPDEGYALKPELADDVKSFSLVFDILIDEGSTGYGGLFQTGTANDTDGDLFIRDLGEGAFGIGINGQYDGSFQANEWVRLAFTIEEGEDGQSELIKYINGVEVGRQMVSSDRFTIDAETGFLILADNDGETHGGYLANFAFTPETLSADTVATLGAAAAEAPALGLLGEDAVIHDFIGGQVAGTVAAKTGADLVNLGYDPASELDPDLALAFGADGPDGGYLVTGEFDAPVETFTLFYDLMIDEGDFGTYGGLFQTGTANTDDGDLFLRVNDEGGFGIGISGNYQGNFIAGEWARLAFTVEALGDGQSRLKKFINGEMVGEQIVDTARFTIDPASGFLILTDNDNETFPGKLSAFSITDRLVDDAEISALGGATAGGALRDRAPGETLVAFDFQKDAKIVNGTADASFGSGTILDREFEAVEVVNDILHKLLKAGDIVEIDLASVFGGDNLSYAIESSDDTALDAVIEDGILKISANALGFADFTVTATDDLGNSASDNFRMRVAGDNAWTFAVLPDTQNYTNNNRKHIYQGMIDWLADNQESMRLTAATHVGDVTGSNRDHQWDIVSDIYETLDEAGLPYTFVMGNHDQADGGSARDHSSLIDGYFSQERYFESANEGGVYDGEPDSIRNNYKTFTAPDGTDWIILSLEFGPRDDVLLWADEVLNEYADHRAMVLTHHYTNMADIAGPNSGPLYAEGTGKNYGMADSAEAVNDGRDIWDKLLSKHGNVSFVFSGHVFGDGAETIIRYGEQGNAVAQIFVNYQDGVAPIITGAGLPGVNGNGGNGAMRLVIIDPDNDEVHTETYFDNLDVFMTTSRGAPEPSRDGRGTIEGEAAEIQPVTFGTTEELGVPAIEGDDGTASAIKLPHFNSDNGLLVTPAFSPAEGGNLFNHYTLVYDLWLPENVGLTSILQTELLNATDGDFWIQTGEGGVGLIGASGQDDGPFQLGDWSRIAVVFERLEGDGVRYRADKYVDGVLIGSQIFEGERRTVKDGGFILFGDDGGETPTDWVMSSFAFVEKALAAEEVAALGEVSVGGPFSELPDGVNGLQIGFDDGRFNVVLGSGSVSQELPDDGGLELTGAYREHQETIDELDITAPEIQFRAVAGADQKVETGAKVMLDAGNSVDLLDQVTKAEWYDADGMMIAEGMSAEITATGGANRYTLRLTGEDGVISTDSVLIMATDEDTLFHDDFNDGTLEGWKVLSGAWDEAGATRSGSGREEGHLQANRSSAGLILIDEEGASSWNGYTIRAEIENENESRIGLVIGANEDGDMYRLEFSVSAHEFALVKIVDGERTVLAVQHDGPIFDAVSLVELSLDNGRLMAAVDGRLLFGGAVVDDAPLTGTAGFFHDGAFRANIDNVSVRKGALIADAGADQRILDLDGDGRETMTLSSREGEAEWTLDGEAVSADTVELTTGHHVLGISQTMNGETDQDIARVELVAKRDILMTEDFSGDASAWRFVDEGERGDLAAWSIEDGELLQSADRYSRQLRGEGDTASSTWWALDWSPLGDGYHALRKGTYAVAEIEGAENWSDYSVAFDFTAPSGGAVGLLFYYQDPDNHYKLELDRNGGTSQLIAVVDGIEEMLWQGAPDYDLGGANRLRVDIHDDVITATLDGFELFAPIGTKALSEGGVALYNWGAPGTSYDNVEVISLRERNLVEGDEIGGSLTGTEGDDLIMTGGRLTVVETGAGADVIVFSTTTNGTRERTEITDFDVTEDRLDLMGGSIAQHREAGGDVYLLLEGDGDIITLRGVASFDEIELV